MITAPIIGMIYTKGFNFELVIHSNWAPVRFFIMSFGTLSFAMLCSLLLKRGGLAIFFYFAYILLIEPIMRSVILFKFKSSLANYLPLNALEDNMLMPLHRIGNSLIKFMEDLGFEYVLNLRTAAIAGTIISTLFVMLSWRKFSNDDI